MMEKIRKLIHIEGSHMMRYRATSFFWIIAIMTIAIMDNSNKKVR